MRHIDQSRLKFLSIMQVVLIIMVGLALALMLSDMPIVVSVAAVLLVGLFVLFLHRPDYALLVVLLVRASTDLSFSFFGSLVGPRDEALGAVPNVALILVLILCGGLFVLARRVPLFSIPGGRLIGLLLLMGLIGLARSSNFLFSAKQWLPILASLIVYAMAAYLFRSPRQLQRVIDIMLISFAVPATFGFLQWITGEGIVARYDPFTQPRLFGTFVHPNSFGFYLVVIISLFLCQVLFQTGTRKAVSLIGFFGAMLLLVGTYARVAWVGAGIVLLTVGVLRSRLLLVVVPIAVILAIALVPSVGARAAAPLEGSLADRFYKLWPGILREWRLATDNDEGPLVVAVIRLSGLGPGAGHVLASRGYGATTPPHDDYLRVLVEYGAFGLMLFISLFVVLFLFAFRTWNEVASRNDTTASVALSFLSLSLAFPIMSLTDNVFGYSANQVYFWTLAGLTVAAFHLISQHVDDTPMQTPERMSLSRLDRAVSPLKDQAST